MKTQIIDEVKKRKLQFIENEVLKITELDKIRTKSRVHEYVLGRYLFCWFAREYTNYSYATIGAFLNRDHATVLHNVRSCEWEIQYNKELQAKHEALKIIMESQFMSSMQRDELENKIQTLEEQLKRLKQYYYATFNTKRQDETNLKRVGSSNIQLDVASLQN
jgi:chromosomal replication initiation ATPase DnaA